MLNMYNSISKAIDDRSYALGIFIDLSKRSIRLVMTYYLLSSVVIEFVVLHYSGLKAT